MNGAVPSWLAGLHLTTGDALDLPQAAGPGALPQLASGQIHEWFFSSDGEPPRSTARLAPRKMPWHPPLTILAHFAGQAARTAKVRRIVWIGRNCWPTPQLLCAVSNAPVAEALRWSLFLDPLTDAERFWAIGQALRCPGIAAVVADGSGINNTVSRRLQLAAESRRAENEASSKEPHAGALGLLARPLRERDTPSWAATRWEVRPRPDKTVFLAPAHDARTGQGAMQGEQKAGEGPGWEIELISCRGQHREQDAPHTWLADWSYQVFRGTGALHFSPGVGYRTAATQPAPATRLAGKTA